MADPAHMRDFWDARARENALYFVDNTLDYRNPDAARFWRQGEDAVDRILDSLGVELRRTDHVVEIGCGVGRLTRPLAARAGSVTATDVSPEMLARARELNPELDSVRWLQGDGTTLAGVPDASADACLSFVVFQHIPDTAVTFGYVGEMGRVLRAGGWAAFQVSNDPEVHRPDGSDPAWLGSAVDLDELAQTADSAAMEVERVRGEGTQFCLVLLRKRPR